MAAGETRIGGWPVVVVIGLLLGVNFFLNHWIKKELQVAVPAAEEASPVEEAEDSALPGDPSELEFDPEDDAEEESSPVAGAEKEQEREQEEKIIYELPISEKYLLQ